MSVPKKPDRFRSRLGGWLHIWSEVNGLTMKDLLGLHFSMTEEIEEFLNFGHIELNTIIGVVCKDDKTYITFSTNSTIVATLTISSSRIEGELIIHYDMKGGNRIPQPRSNGVHVDMNGLIIGACTEDYLSEKLVNYKPNEEL